MPGTNEDTGQRSPRPRLTGPCVVASLEGRSTESGRDEKAGPRCCLGRWAAVLRGLPKGSGKVVLMGCTLGGERTRTLLSLLIQTLKCSSWARRLQGAETETKGTAGITRTTR